MFKKIWGLHYIYILLICFSGIQTAVSYFLNKPVFYIFLIAFLLVFSLAIFNLVYMSKKINSFIKSINADLDSTTSNALSFFNLPVMIASSSNEIIWFNSKFVKEINNTAENLVGKNLEEFLGNRAFDNLQKHQKATFSFENHILDAYQTVYTIGGEEQKILCFVDLTELRKTATEYKLSRPVVAFVAIDNLDDITRDLRDSERNSVISKIQNVLEDWFATVSGISHRLSGEKYLFVFEERDLISFTSNKFDVLNRVRNIDFGDKGSATVSIGIGLGSTFKSCEHKAAQALDMALGRGGDQVAIKDKENSFKFFGGISGGNQASTRVRARMAASTIFNMIKNSENIVLMGHKFADLDCFASAYALCSAIKKTTDKPAVVALNKETSLINNLLNRLKSLGADNYILEPEKVLPTVDKTTLLIILDTHRKALLESPEIFAKAGTVIIIDHHRKAVDFINDSALFYHDPASSSSCEMVSEILQYISYNAVGKPEAEALLSGICLDTKNFSVNTGVRTFEASAYLRKRGADTIAVKKLFADSIEGYKIKNSVISSAKQFGNYVIAINDAELPDEEKRIVSSSAADELLNISGVSASFVISKLGDVMNISARSYGDINVQLIMEKLGGGGHRNMAACQIAENDYNNVKTMLINAINSVEKG